MIFSFLIYKTFSKNFFRFLHSAKANVLTPSSLTIASALWTDNCVRVRARDGISLIKVNRFFPRREKSMLKLKIVSFGTI